MRKGVEPGRCGRQKQPVQILEYGDQQQSGVVRTSTAAIAPVGNRELASRWCRGIKGGRT
jgi:hypothetical protein